MEQTTNQPALSLTAQWMLGAMNLNVFAQELPYQENDPQRLNHEPVRFVEGVNQLLAQGLMEKTPTYGGSVRLTEAGRLRWSTSIEGRKILELKSQLAATDTLMSVEPAPDDNMWIFTIERPAVPLVKVLAILYQPDQGWGLLKMDGLTAFEAKPVPDEHVEETQLIERVLARLAA